MDRMNRARWGLVVAAVTIAVADLAQVVLLDWRPKHWGSLGGAALYIGVAVGAVAGLSAADVVALAIPLIPITLLSAWALGLPVPVAPDRAMVLILIVQLSAAGFGALRLQQRRAAASAQPRD